jgi:hypothetical protein
MTSNSTDDISDGYHTFGELYEHRAALLAALMHCAPERAWMSRLHHDGTAFEGFFIAGMELPAGQITYHVRDVWWAAYQLTGANVCDRAPIWDEHDPAHVIARLRLWAIS